MTSNQQTDRYSQQEQQDRRLVAAAIARLSRILTPGFDDTPSVAPEDDAVLCAAEIVARRCGVRMRTVPALPAEMSASDRLQAAARTSSFRVRRVKLAPGWWRTDAGPLLCFGKADNRPLCALPEGPARYLLVDPQTGVERRADQAAAEELAENAFTFYPALPNGPLDWRHLLAFGFSETGADLRRLLLSALAAALLGLVTPLSVKVLFDTAIPFAEQSLILQLTLVMVAAALGAGAFEAVRAIAFIRLETRAEGRVEAAVWDRLLRLPAHFFRDYAVGDLTHRAMGVSTMRRIVSGVTLVAFLSGAFGLVNFALMFVLDTGLAFAVVAMTAAWFVPVWLCTRAQAGYLRESFAIQGRLVGRLVQFIGGIAKLRSAGAELRAFSVWANGFARQKKAHYQGMDLGNWVTAIGAGFVVLTSAVLFAVVAMVYDDMAAGTFVAFLVAFGQFAAAAIAATQAFSSSLVLMPLYERLKPILEARPEIDPSRAYPGLLSGAVSVNDVTFRYDPNGPPVLEDVSIHAEPGEFIALVGPSGAGKSTLLRLLLGFEEPEVGTITYDDKDLAQLDVAALRRQLGVVLQKSGLLPGDIFSNIVGSADLSQDDAWEAARLAGIADDIAAMPMGMQTMISEDAGTISGGQKQRLIIARALVRRPRILLFDEATSALDNKTQKLVSDSLEQLAATRIVIAHRLSTIRHADRIYVVVGGRVVQSGAYADLMAEEGAFRQLAERQLA